MFDIRYTKFKFEVELIESCMLPKYKTSALRGGMGNMLLNFSCIKDGDCKKCGFCRDCVVQNIMYPKALIEMPCVTETTSTPGYIIECFDEREYFEAGDKFTFNLLLFGRTIVYLYQFIHAFDSLGQKGIGLGGQRYNLQKIYNESNELIFEDGYLYKKNIKINRLNDYINQRKGKIERINEIKFITPLRLLRKGKFVDDISFEDIINSASRRLVVLNAFEGIEVKPVDINEKVEVTYSKLQWVDYKRYSSTQKKNMKFGGVKGTIKFSKEINNYLDYIIGCELLHLGKNTAFGFGKYIII